MKLWLGLLTDADKIFIFALHFHLLESNSEIDADNFLLSLTVVPLIGIILGLQKLFIQSLTDSTQKMSILV